ESSGLSRVSAMGGVITRVTSIAEDQGDFAHDHPMFLPDGKRFLFLVKSTRPERAGVYRASLDDPSNITHLLQDSSNVGLGDGPDGRTHLFFVRDTTLLAQPFDLAREVVRASPMLVH